VFSSHASSPSVTPSLDCSNNSLSPGRSSPGRKAPRRLRRRWLALGLAAALALPVAAISLHSSRLFAATTTNVTTDVADSDNLDLQNMSNADRLQLGLTQYSKGQYEEAVATLQQVNAEMLGPKDQQTLKDTLSRAQNAADQRKAARAEFEQGEQALNANRPAEALQHYKNASSNRYADDGTRAKAKEQSALADQENPQRPEHEHHERVAEQPVGEPASPRSGAVLVHGQGLDVADAPLVEVAGRRVVDGVLVAPPRKRRVEDDAQYGAERCVCALAA